MSSVQFLLTAALALVLFLTLANLTAVQYGRGAIRSGLEQGARAGAIAVSPARCEAVAGDVISQLLGGRMADSLVLSCVSSGSTMNARAAVVFDSWGALVPDFPLELEAEAVIEPEA